MAIKLFITPQELTESTIISGNVDFDKYTFSIEFTQISIIEPLLGSELYDKIVSDFPTYAGDYSTLYTEFIKPITKYAAAANYISVAPYILSNGGLYKHSPENAEVVSKEETDTLSDKYSAMAQMYIQRFEKWICKNPLTEYKRYQDEVDAQNISLTAGWHFGGSIGLTEDELGFERRYR